MVRIQSIGEPTSGAHWSYGPDHMCRISARTARGLCGMYPLPRMGCETNVAIARGARPLTVQNISGDYYAASTQWQIAEWPNVYGVTVIPPRT